MLPGIRFLIATLLLSASVVVFGLGAVSLLRATRQDVVASPPTWDAPEAVVARERDTRKATLALLRVEMIADQDSNVEKMAALAAAAPSPAPIPEAGAATPAATAAAVAVDGAQAPVVSDPAPATSAAEAETTTVAMAEPPAPAVPVDRSALSSDAVQPGKPDVTVIALLDPAAASAEVAIHPALAPAAKPAAKAAAASAGKARIAAAKREKARQAAAQRRRVAQRARTVARPLQPQTMQQGNPFAGFGG